MRHPGAHPNVFLTELRDPSEDPGFRPDRGLRSAHLDRWHVWSPMPWRVEMRSDDCRSVAVKLMQSNLAKSGCPCHLALISLHVTTTRVFTRYSIFPQTQYSIMARPWIFCHRRPEADPPAPSTSASPSPSAIALARDSAFGRSAWTTRSKPCCCRYNLVVLPIAAIRKSSRFP